MKKKRALQIAGIAVAATAAYAGWRIYAHTPYRQNRTFMRRYEFYPDERMLSATFVVPGRRRQELVGDRQYIRCVDEGALRLFEELVYSKHPSVYPTLTSELFTQLMYDGKLHLHEINRLRFNHGHPVDREFNISLELEGFKHYPEQGLAKAVIKFHGFSKGNRNILRGSMSYAVRLDKNDSLLEFAGSSLPDSHA